jgi:hypothetical protein
MISEAERPPLQSQLFFQRRRRRIDEVTSSIIPWPSSLPIVATNRGHRYRVRICSPRKAFEWNERGRPWRPSSRSRGDPPSLPREARRHVARSPYSALFCQLTNSMVLLA